MEVCCDPRKLLRNERYKQAYESCVAPAELVEAFRRVSEPTTLLIVLGFWCPDSLRLVPCTTKAFAEAANANLQIIGVSVPHEETEQIPVHVGPFEIRKFPTFILLRGQHEQLATTAPDQEIVRFVEQPVDPSEV
jgi:thiol-disulfide isomerase/thioredoxin